MCPEAQPSPTRVTCLPTGWDDPTCTEGVVTVSRGACAVMSCTISHPLSNVTVCLSAQVPVCLSADGKNQPLVSRKVPGSPADGGWQLRVHGAVAQLVIDGAQDAQAGQYTWYLEGFQRSIRTTTLSVSGQRRAGAGHSCLRAAGEGQLPAPEVPRARDAAQCSHPGS